MFMSQIPIVMLCYAVLSLSFLRDGLEDLEYMYAAEARVGRDRVLAEVKAIVSSTHKWEHEAMPYWEAREKIAALAEDPESMVV